MQLNRNIRGLVRAAAGVVAVAVFGIPAIALAALPPHVPLSAPTGSCAICHRAHTANTAQSFLTTPTLEMTGTSLLVSGDPLQGDATLCYACHGIGQLGSNVDVQTSFSGSSVHSLAPEASPYGPSPLYCSSCHDAHGTARMAGGSPYPALLRAWELSPSFEGTRAILSGEAYCATCHTVEAAAAESERWSGLAVYMSTAHYSAIATPTSGTDIRCSRCHDPHGSSVAPLLVGSIVPTSVVSTFTVTADDRTFCIACHPDVTATWSGETTYATSAHALSSVTTTISARWVPEGQRKVGECQVCHAPMGADDGTGIAIPKLLDAEGRALCDVCHAPDAVASTDTSSQARPMQAPLTLTTVYAPQVDDVTSGRIQLYGRVDSGAGTLEGPRSYDVAEGAGPSAAGDIDSDGVDELVVASPDSAVITVFDVDPLTGLTLQPDVYAIPAGTPAKDLLVVDTIVGLAAGVREIALVTSAGDLVFYHLSGGVLVEVASVPVGATGPWALASGDVTSSALADVVVTNRSAGTLTIVTDDGFLGHTAITVSGVGLEPVAPSVGDVSPADPGAEIVVCDAAAAATATVRVFDGAGALLAGEEYTITAGLGRPTAGATGDVLWGDAASRADLAVAFTDPASGESSVVVIAQDAGGLSLSSPDPIEVSTGGAGSFTGSLLIGDTDADGHADLVAGNGGLWATDATARAPRTLVLTASATGTALAAADVYRTSGTEYAGPAPALVLADLGAPLPSRHPIDEVASASHVSTETAPFDRHVTCSDCHNSHEASSTVVAAAPAVQGLLKGAWGVSVTYGGPSPVYGDPSRSATSYGVCFKCHSSYVGNLAGRSDVAREFDPGNPSTHAIYGPSTSDVRNSTFVSGWAQNSTLYCTDCHGGDGVPAGQADGLHESDSAPLLDAPYLAGAPYSGAEPADAADALCFSCHKYGVYYTGADVAAPDSYFVSGTAGNLHPLHAGAVAAGGHGVSCSSCHVSHGSSTYPVLLRGAEIGYVAGSCTNDCHGGVARSYP